MSIGGCDKWTLVGKSVVEEWRSRTNPDDATYEAVKKLLSLVELDPFDAVESEGVPGNAPINTRCAFVPGTNIVVTWLITIRQCQVTILHIHDALQLG